MVTEQQAEKMDVLQLLAKLEEVTKEEDSRERDDKLVMLDKEIRDREPWSNIDYRIEELEQKLKGMQKAIDKLKNHTHNNKGEAVCPL